MNICRSNDLQNSMTYIEILFKNIKVKGGEMEIDRETED